jgi:hypothetical protein
VQGLSLDLDQNGKKGEVDAWGSVSMGRPGMEAAESHQLPVADSIVEVRQEKASHIHRFPSFKEFVCLFVTPTPRTHQGLSVDCVAETGGLERKNN